MQGTARGRCFRFPHERPNEHSPLSIMRRRTNDSCNARPAQGPKRMQGTARGRCFCFPHERQNEHSPYRRANDSCNARPAQGPKRMQGTARGRCFRFPHESPKRAFAILYYASQDKRIVQHEPHLPVIGNAARLHANELRLFLILLPYHNSRQPGDDLLRAVCCFFRFTKLN